MYHVLSRGDKNGFIFPTDNAKGYFVKLLGKGAESHHIDVYAFCVMGTHYHLLIQITEKNLSEFMHYLGSSSANYLVRNGWAGHVFSGRFKSILVEKEEYLLTVSRYIHLNPVSAGLVKRPEAYRWSSYPLYFSRGEKATWIRKDWLVEYFGPDAGEAAKGYHRFTMAGVGNPSDYPHEKVVANAVLGSEGFLRTIQSYLGEKDRLCESIELELLRRRLSLDDLCKGVCKYFGISDLSVGDYRKDRGFKHGCNMFIYAAREYTRASNQEIGEILGDMPPNTISRRYGRTRKKMIDDGVYRRRVGEDIRGIVEGIRDVGTKDTGCTDTLAIS